MAVAAASTYQLLQYQTSTHACLSLASRNHNNPHGEVSSGHIALHGAFLSLAHQTWRDA